MKKITFLLLPIFILSSCSSVPVENTSTEAKTDFIISTVTFSDLEKNFSIEKSSKIEASSEVTISTETNWRVEKILVKEWDEVVKGQALAYLSDNSLNLDTNYRQTVLNLEQAKISYDSQKLALDKAVEDAETNLEKLKISYENTKKSLEQDLIQAKDNLNNSTISNISWKTGLDIQRLDNSITKQELEYQTQLKSNQDKIFSYISSLNREVDNLNNLFTNAIETWDQLFFVKSWGYKPDVYTFIWATNTVKKAEAERYLKEMIDYQKNILSSLKLEKEADFITYMNKVDESYTLLKNFLNASLDTVNASLVGLSWFTESQKATYSSTLNGYISSTNWNYSAFVSQRSWILSFLNTYKETEEALLKQLNLAKSDREIALKSYSSNETSSKVSYEKVIINSNDTISNLEIQLKTAESNLQNAIQSREITLKNLENSIKNSSLAVEKATNEISKLTLTAPISWQISNISLTLWQTYNAWVEGMKIISTSKRELDVYVSSEDLEKINIWDKVKITYRWEEFEWEIFSKSNVANETLNYKVKVSLNKEINLVWWVANVTFSVKTKYPLLPVNSVTVLHSEDSKKIWEIKVLKNAKIEALKVELWEVFWKNIEIKTELEENLQIILSDVTNFNEEKFELKVN